MKSGLPKPSLAHARRSPRRRRGSRPDAGSVARAPRSQRRSRRRAAWASAGSPSSEPSAAWSSASAFVSSRSASHGGISVVGRPGRRPRRCVRPFVARAPSRRGSATARGGRARRCSRRRTGPSRRGRRHAHRRDARSRSAAPPGVEAVSWVRARTRRRCSPRSSWRGTGRPRATRASRSPSRPRPPSSSSARIQLGAPRWCS